MRRYDGLCPKCEKRPKEDGYAYCKYCNADYQREYRGMHAKKIAHLEAEVARLRMLLAWAGIDPDAK